jgi:hypothetical protein
MKNVACSLFLLMAFVALNSCSVIKKNDPEKRVRAYLKEFENDLQDSDLVILSHFQVDKSKEAIMKAIRIMQNMDVNKDSVRCIINFSEASVFFGENNIIIGVEGKHISLDALNPFEQITKFTMLLKPDNDSFKIHRFEADNFYFNYLEMVREIKEKKNREREIASKKIFFDQARKLRQTYDSVIWVTRYQDSIYYYVVNGKWKNYFLDEKDTKPDSVNMGLVSETGRIIVPPEYSLIGTIAFEEPDVIEVKKNGKVGLFNMDGKELVAAVYDLIIPYDIGLVASIVKQDSIYGWLDNSYEYHQGFPDLTSKNYIKQYKYLSREMMINSKSKPVIEILHIENMYHGIVVPSNYLFRSGVTKEIISGIFTVDNALGWGWLDYIQVRGSMFKNITQKLSAFIVSLKTGYVEGREGFYESNNITFVDEKDNQVAKYESKSGEIEFNKIDSALLEIKINTRATDYESFSYAMGKSKKEWNFPNYQYMSLVEGVRKFESTRIYSFTEFVKMDSSYLKGEFFYWDETKQKSGTRTFLSDETIEDIRNEILASNGYIFADEKISKESEYRKWYKPRYARYKDVIDNMSEIDKHNLQFLESIVGTLNAEGVVL